jgi:hypothetical protein
MSNQVAHNFVKSVYTDFFNKTHRHFLYYLADGLARYYHEEDSPHKQQLYAVIVTSAPTQKVKVIKFDIRIENINDHYYLTITCGKFNITVEVKRPDFTNFTAMNDFINYTIYRCLEGFVQIPYEIVQKTFFVYSPDEVSYNQALEESLEGNPLFWPLSYWCDIHLTEDDEQLKSMIVVLKDLLEECKKIPGVLPHEMKKLTSIYERHETVMEKELEPWLERDQLLNAVMLFLVISCKYIHSH